VTIPADSGLAAPRDWWRGAVIYQIYPRSFQDASGDGVGDLAGIIQRLDHVASLGVDAVWLSPFFTSPMLDYGYDVADYRDVDPLFGTLADFDRLLAAAHARGLRVIIDLVISHTSDRHPWFRESRRSRADPRADWYVWAEAKPDGTAPNNWLSLFGGPAWEWDATRQQYYLHNFLREQPDLNFHHPAVQEAVLDVARFWLERGVDGFRLDTVNFYFHDAALTDNPPLADWSGVTTVQPSNPYARQNHIHDKNQPEMLPFLERLRALLDSYPGATAVGELCTDQRLPELMAAYTEAGKRLPMAYSFGLFTPDISAAALRRIIAGMESSIGSGWPSWALSNHDFARVVSRWRMADCAAAFAPVAVALLLSLRGSPCLYQGEELGLPQAQVPFALLKDPYGIRFWPEYVGRDGCRTPMPWTADSHGGFTTAGATPWLPVPAEHRALCVATQEAEEASVLQQVRRLLAFRRKHAALRLGSITLLETPEPILAFWREQAGERVLCAFNLGRADGALATADLGASEPLFTLGAARHDGESLQLPACSAWFGLATPAG
jgi:alpha-glucosidase